MLWLAHHNPKIDWKKGEVKIIRCSEECEKKWDQSKENWGSKNKKKRKEEEKKKEKITEKQDDGCKESSERIRDFEWKRSSKIRERN